MEAVVVGALGPIRLKNYHGCCKAKDASLHAMNNITATSESTAHYFDKIVENKAALYDAAVSE